jgi:WXXGXW repeat (2 copies)
MRLDFPKIIFYLALSGVLFLAACVVQPARPPRPEPIVEVPAPAPAPGYRWVKGHYRWEGDRWIWKHGHWVPL